MDAKLEFLRGHSYRTQFDLVLLHNLKTNSEQSKPTIPAKIKSLYGPEILVSQIADWGGGES